MKKKKRVNIVVFFIFMIFMFILFDFASSIIPSFLSSSIQGTKYGVYFTAELFWLILVISVIYLAKNSYVFSEKKETFTKTLLIGTPIFLFSIVYFFINLKHINDADPYTVVSLMLYAITIGMTEEFMCRGWILNEFLERYGDKRKTVILSIIFSALIFGGMHISNIWVGGQTISETLIQITFATAAGIFFGSLYYRTRNLWAIAFLHGFYDFSLLLEDLQYVKDCTSNPTSFNFNMYSLAVNGGLSIILILSAFVIIRKSKTSPNEEITKEELDKDNLFKKGVVFSSIAIFILINSIPYKFFGVKDSEVENHQTCYKYDEIELGYIEISNNNKDIFTFNINNKEYIFNKDSDKVTLEISDGTNNITKTIIKKDVDKFDIIEEQDKLLLVYAKQGSLSIGSTVYYTILDKNREYVEEDLDVLSNSFIKFDLPSLVLIGKLTTTDDDYNYIVLEDYMNNKYIINKDNQLKKIKIRTNKNKIIIEKEKAIEKENEKLGEELLNNVPFLKYKYNEYNDAYRGTSINIANISEETILANAYDNSKQEQLDIPIYSDICANMNPCIGELYVSKEEIINKLETMYNKNDITKTSFAYAKGLVELKENYYVYISTNERDNIKRVSKIINIEKNNNEIIIEEKAAFISKTIISKYSNIEESMIEDLKSEEESVYKEYFESNIDKFATFKHKFNLNQETNTYYYVETITN